MSNETQQETPETAAATAPVEQPETTAPAPAVAEDPMAVLKAEAERFRDLALRGQADFENYRKRSVREKEDAVKYANMDLLERLIPILDNFELGLSAARGSSEGASILVGMEMVARQLQDFLKSCGVEPVPAEGQKFDANVHDAVAQEASATVPEGNVIRQLRAGYKLKDRLLRAATVVVSKGAEE
jgi:molecular chaperone GrpE